MKFIRLVSLAVLLACVGNARAAAPRPNIIFVLVDDLGYGDLGAFYQNSRNHTENRHLPAFSTPHLDVMAAGGMRLTRHYSPAPVCAPSRASLILGVHQGHANIRDNQFDKELEDNHTLGTVMQGAGYATACIGKWGLQGPGTPANQPSHPSRRGFDYFFGYLSHLSGHYHYPEQLSGNDNQGQPNGLFENTTNVTSQFAKCYSTDLFTARAKKWIVDHHAATPEKPFFLYLSHPAPHARLDVPTQAYPAGSGLNGGLQWIGTPGTMINTASGTINSWIHPDYASATWDHDQNPSTAEVAWPDHAKRHATMIRRLDDAMADLGTLLADLGIGNNTLIVFTSDNGPHNESGSGGSYAYNPTFFRSYAGMDGIKRDLWEGGVRVPAIVRWPDGIVAGSTSNTAAQFHDWLPTFAELAGIPQPARSDGISLVPTLTGEGTRKESIVYSEYQHSSNTPNYANFENSHITTRNQMQMVHIGGFKGVRYNTTSHATDFRIYNVANDPKETTNLSGQPGVPTQQDFKDKVLRIRRANTTAARSYDGQQIPSISPGSIVNGLDFHAYEMTTSWVPDWETQTSASSGQSESPDLSVRTREENIGLLFSGYINIPTSGTYTFHLNTDTGSFVRLHDAQLIDADAGYTPGSEKSSGSIPLAAGLHPIRIHYRHTDAASHLLDLQWSGPGIAKQAIPASAWFRDGEPVPVPPSANPDNASTTGAPAVSVWIDVLANDFDDGTPEPLSITEISPPQHGTAVIEANGIRYTPSVNFLGTDTFDYTISDGAETSTATVTVEVFPISDILWLPLDETEGFVAHNALGQPIGTLTGFASPGWEPGRLGGALRFFGDGNIDSVALVGNKGITGTAARTVTFWLKADADQGVNSRATMISWGANNSSTAGVRFDLNLNHTNGYQLRAEFNASGVNFTTPAHSDLRDSGWVHCAIVMPQNATVSQLLAYLDGELATSAIEPAGSGSTAINTSSVNDITIGKWASDNGRAFRGALDDIRIYPRALSASEISALASRPPGSNHRDQWFYRHSGNDAPTEADWQADPDHDGFNNWLEYALGGNPTAISNAISPTLHQNDDWEFRFNRRRSDIPPSAYLPEISETLQSWNSLDVFSIAPHPEMTDFDLITVPLPPSSASARFVRLQVER